MLAELVIMTKGNKTVILTQPKKKQIRNREKKNWKLSATVTDKQKAEEFLKVLSFK